MSSGPTDVEGHEGLMALKTSELGIYAVDSESVDWKLVEKLPMWWVLKTLLKYVAKASAASLGRDKGFCSFPSSLRVLSFFLKGGTYFQNSIGFFFRL